MSHTQTVKPAASAKSLPILAPRSITLLVVADGDKKAAPKRRKQRREEEELRIKRAFAANLRRAMFEAGYETNWQLMLDSGVGNATIGRYLAAEQEAGIVKATRLAAALGIPVTDLFRDPRELPTTGADRRRRSPAVDPVGTVAHDPRVPSPTAPRRRASD